MSGRVQERNRPALTNCPRISKNVKLYINLKMQIYFINKRRTPIKRRVPEAKF